MRDTFKLYCDFQKANWKDYRKGACSLRTFLDCAVPVPVYRAYRVVREPRWAWRMRQERQWAKKLPIGAEICTCMNSHSIVVDRLDDTTVIDQDGIQHDLISCCSETKADLSCHAPPLYGFMERYNVKKIVLEGNTLDPVLYFNGDEQLDGEEKPWGIQEFEPTSPTYKDFYNALWGQSKG